MATDQSPPRTRLIVMLTIVTVASLGILKPIFDSYFTDMFESEAKAKLAAPDEVRKQRAEEDQKLNGGPLSIDKAMGAIALGREGVVSPLQSGDTAPLVGWSRLAAEAGTPPKLDVPSGAMAPMMMPATGDASAPNDASMPARDAGR